MNRLLPMALLVFCGWSCRSAIDLRDPLEGLPASGTFSFFHGEDRWNRAEELLQHAVDSCGWSRALEDDPDLVLRWELPQLVTICLDYWDVGCEDQEASISVTTAASRALWHETLPGWCGVRDCLLKLFVRDLKKGLCTNVPPNQAASADATRRFARGVAAERHIR
jgi:hypothetical protein